MGTEKKLFKYVDEEGALAILENGNLLFSSPLHFNDPFDISIQTLFAYDAFDLEGFLDEFIRLAISDEPLPEGNGSKTAIAFTEAHAALLRATEEYRRNFREALSAASIWDENRLRENSEETLLAVKSSFDVSGIFCASRRFDNYLLWAHYADKHQGAVLEFSPNLERDSVLRLAEEVQYSSKRPSLYESHRDFLFKAMFQETTEFLREYTKRITTTKSAEWAYEEELRVYVPALVNVFKGKKSHCLDYHPDELRSVYLGCKMGSEARRKIAMLAGKRNPDVRIFDMVPDPREYKLAPITYR